MPNGSIADLLARLERHFDPNVTPPGLSIEPIVRMIPSSVASADLPKLMKEAQARLTTKLGNLTMRRANEQVVFFDAIFASGQQQSISALVTHLVALPDFFTIFIRRHPERLPFFATFPALIRELWRKHLFAGGRADLSVFAALVRNQLIPQAEFKEACERAVAGLNGDVPSPIDTPDLIRAGWVDQLREYTFGEANKINEFAWGNRNAASVQWLLMHEPISPEVAEVAKKLCNTFELEPYPFAVCTALREFFVQDVTKKAEFVAAATQANVTPPASLI